MREGLFRAAAVVPRRAAVRSTRESIVVIKAAERKEARHVCRERMLYAQNVGGKCVDVPGGVRVSCGLSFHLA